MNSKNKITILHIDHEPKDIKNLKELLENASIRYDYFNQKTLEEGISFASGNQPDIVLLELNLEERAGFKNLTRFLEKITRIPVIVVTKSANEIIGNQSIKAGAQDFLVKGQFNAKILGRSIRYALQRHQTQLQLEATKYSLSKSQKRYIQAQTLANFGNFEMDIVTNKMTWTQEMYNILGLFSGTEHPVLSDYLRLVHREDRPEVETFFDNVAKSTEQSSIEHRIVKEDHTIKHLSLTAKLFFDEITDKVLLVGGVQDITERKISEQLILEKNINTRASKVKQEALLNMSFHIRTPLASVVNLLFLLDQSRLDPQQQEYMDGLKTSVDDLSIMVNNLLNFSMLVTDQIELEESEIKTKEFVQGIQKAIHIKADNSQLPVKFKFSKKLSTTIISDQFKLTQICYNLTDSAIRNSSKQSNLVIASTIQADKEDNHFFVFKIKDIKTLLSKEQLKKLTSSEKLLEIYPEEAEAETEAQQELLSLAMVYKLTSFLKGEFLIKSTESAGTLYEVFIPVKVVKHSKRNPAEKPKVTVKILLVEDHFLNQIATKKVLTTWSELVSVDIAENGYIGVEKERSNQYDIILMDIQMPVMDGIKAAKKIRTVSDTPIIALTANSSKQEADRCLEVGMNDYLAKPFKPHELYIKIMNLLSSAVMA